MNNEIVLHKVRDVCELRENTLNIWNWFSTWKVKTFEKLQFQKWGLRSKLVRMKWYLYHWKSFNVSLKWWVHMGKTKKIAWNLWKLENFELFFHRWLSNHLESNSKIKSSLMEFTICNTNHQWNIYISVMKTYYQTWFTKKWQKGKQKKPSKGYYKAINIMHVNS